MRSTSLQSAERIGSQTPTWLARPSDAFDNGSGDDAIELAALAGLKLDEWQQLVLRESLAVRESDPARWAATTVSLKVGRQNGKGSDLEARQLAGLVLFRSRLAVHTAHELKTTAEHFLRMQQLIEGCPDIERQVMRIRTGKGDEAIEMRSGCRLRFIARSGGGGRGFSADDLYLDEDMFLTEAMMRAVYSTMAARSRHGNPQMWLTGSAPRGDDPNQAWSHGQVSVNRSSRRPDRTLYIDYGTIPPTADDIKAAGSVDAAVEAIVGDRERWYATNPGLGVRISEDFIEAELSTLGPLGFAVERLGLVIPKEDAQNRSGIDLTSWSKLFGEFELGRAVVAVDVDEDGARGTIAAAANVGGVLCVEVVEMGGIGKLVGWLTRNASSIDRVVYDGTGQAQMVVTLAAGNGLRFDKLAQADVASSEAMLVDAVAEAGVRHRDDPRVRSALLSADRVSSGKRWRWAPRRPLDDVTPLKAAALAVAAARSPEAAVFAY